MLTQFSIALNQDASNINTFISRLIVYEGNTTNGAKIADISHQTPDSIPICGIGAPSANSQYLIKIVRKLVNCGSCNLTLNVSLKLAAISNINSVFPTSISTTCGSNLISNGGFENGITGFSIGSNYALLTNGSGPGFILITGNPASVNPGWSGGSASGSKFLCVDSKEQGGGNLNTIISQTITVCANKNYKFQTSLKNINFSASPKGKLIISIGNNIVVNQTFTINNNNWEELSFDFNSGNNTSIQIFFKTGNNVAIGGFDFGIDEVEVREIQQLTVSSNSYSICGGSLTLSASVASGDFCNWYNGNTLIASNTNSITVTQHRQPCTP